MTSPYADVISELVRSDAFGEDRIMAIDQMLQFLDVEMFCDYEPTESGLPFFTRCADWLCNVTSSDDRRDLLQFIEHLSFLSHGEFTALYRAAIEELVVPWLLDGSQIGWSEACQIGSIEQALEHTWFVPATDSFRINAFHKAVGLRTAEFQPDLRSMFHLGDSARADAYLIRRGIDRIVVLEDFVGSGTQLRDALMFAASLASQPHVLAVPLFICPHGLRFIQNLIQSRNWTHVECRPVVALDGQDFLFETAQAGEPALFVRIRALALAADLRVYDASNPRQSADYTPFGFRAAGGTQVMYSNCADSTLPLVHQNAFSWRALFPRSGREGP